MSALLSTAKRLRWLQTRTMGAVMRKGKKAIALGVHSIDGGNTWCAMALETTRKAAIIGFSGVLEDHSHKVLGEGLSLAVAKARCRAFGKKWLMGRSTKKCGCAEIAA